MKSRNRNTRALSLTIRRTARRNRFVQIGLIMAIWLAGEALVRATGLPVPGGILGLGATLVLLLSHRVSARSLSRGANWFLAEMLLFFVPAVLAVLDHREFLGLIGLKILLVIVLGTLAVMATTALTVEFCYRWSLRHADPAR